MLFQLILNIIHTKFQAFFHLLFGCSTVNFRPILRGKSHSHCQSLRLSSFDPNVTDSLLTRMSPFWGWNLAHSNSYQNALTCTATLPKWLQFDHLQHIWQGFICNRSSPLSNMSFPIWDFHQHLSNSWSSMWSEKHKIWLQ